MNHPVYIFDVDGVLNDFKIYEPDERILQQMAVLLARGAFVGVNTGRGYEWIEQNVVVRLGRQLNNAKDMDRVFVAAEMGGLGVEFTGGKEARVRSAFSLPKEHIAAVKHLYEQHHKYAKTMGWYAKESMATFDRLEQASLEAFSVDRDEIAGLLRETFKGRHVKVIATTDAVDICAPEAGKWAGAQLIYDWLRRVSTIAHDHFICFGDSVSDYEMARFFAAQSHGAEFILTGSSLDDTVLDERVKVTKTSKRYSHGTFEYLQRAIARG